MRVVFARSFRAKLVVLLITAASLALVWLLAPAVSPEPLSPLYFYVLSGGVFVAIIAHELIHYVVAKVYSPETRIIVYPYLGALLVDYARLPFKVYAVSAWAPIFTLNAALTATWLLTGEPGILMINVLMLLASGLDVYAFFHVLLKHRAERLAMVYDEKGGIIGMAVEEKGLATVYILKR